MLSATAARYEYKYLIPPTRIEAARTLMRPFMAPDRFACSRIGFTYPVCSLYLDSPDLSLFSGTVNGLRNRFKLRIRTYSDAVDAPCYFEVKNRDHRVVRKSRAQVSRLLLDRGLPDPADPATGSDGVRNFLSLSAAVGARPWIRVLYQREAYESVEGLPLRMTLDTGLKYAYTSTLDVSLTRGPWTELPGCLTILEIKFTERFPRWVSELIGELGLRQDSVPKYVMSLEDLLRRKPELRLTSHW